MGENTDLQAPLPAFVLTITLCAFVGVWAKTNNAVPHSLGAIVQSERKHGKGRVGWYSDCMAFSFKLCVGRPPGADRHAIPSPTDIILYQPTEAMQMSEEGGVGKTEQRNFSETG